MPTAWSFARWRCMRGCRHIVYTYRYVYPLLSVGRMGTWRCRRRRTYTLLTCDNPSDLLRPPLTSCLTYCLTCRTCRTSAVHRSRSASVTPCCRASPTWCRSGSSRSSPGHRWAHMHPYPLLPPLSPCYTPLAPLALDLGTARATLLRLGRRGH